MFCDEGRYNHDVWPLLYRLDTLILSAEYLADSIRERGPRPTYMAADALRRAVCATKVTVTRVYPLNDAVRHVREGLGRSFHMDDKAVRAIAMSMGLFTKISFLVACCFEIETLAKALAAEHGEGACKPAGGGRKRRPSVYESFRRAMGHSGVAEGDWPELISIIYKTRNTLHNGGKVDEPSVHTYKGSEYRFVPGEDMEHSCWDALIYLVGEAIRLLGEAIRLLDEIAFPGGDSAPGPPAAPAP